MTALLARVPTTAMRYAAGGIEEVAIGMIAPGDRILVRHGEVVPVDGTVTGGAATLDESTLTGEALPVIRNDGQPVLSGVTNVGMVFDLVTTHEAAESTYAGIVRLVEEAQKSRAPMVRLADRYGLLFLAFTLAVAGAAWVATGDPVRALAVLVVATPCPLILAVPVAIIAGVSRAARIGVLIKGGAALEVLARVGTVVVDKTGTLTEGKAAITDIEPANGMAEDEVLRVAASIDQASKHIVAVALVDEARRRNLVLSPPTAVIETPGGGVEGMIDGRRIAVGSLAFVAAHATDGRDGIYAPGEAAGTVVIAVAVDGRIAGRILLADGVRPEVPDALAGFRRHGARRIVLASGDRADVAEAVGASLDIDAVRSELTPQQKVSVVAGEKGPRPVMMVGDGVNDAPALAAADIGVALGARGSAASSEAADAVLLTDRLDRLADAMGIARRARGIALQSVYFGIGLSMVAMGFAAFGYLEPVKGALLQEAIDVAVILNALRALGGGRPRPATLAGSSDRR
jgi:heavy metal translocating P-type ATPase